MTFRETRPHHVLPESTGNEMLRSPRAASFAVFTLSLLLPVIALRGQVYLNPIAYELSHQTRLMLHGEGLGGYHQWPPGFAVAMLPLVSVGLDALRSGWLVSLVAFACSSVLLFHLLRRIVSMVWACVLTALYTCNPLVLLSANAVSSEMLFTFSLLVAVTAVRKLERPEPDRSLDRMIAGVATGIALAVPLWCRYMGAAVHMAAIPLLIKMWLARPNLRSRLLMSASVAAILSLLLPLRNFIGGGSLMGHPAEGVPADSFASAGVNALWHLAGGIALEHYVAVPPVLQAIVASAVLVVLIGLGVRAVRAAPGVFVAAFPVVYLVLLAGIASHTRIDAISFRFTLPLYPFLSLLLAGWIAGAREEVVGRFSPIRHRYWLTGTLAGAVVCSGVAVLLAGYGKLNITANYSIHTLSWIEEHLSKGSVIAGSRFGHQVQAVLDGYVYEEIPFEDKRNANYTRAFGVRPWTRHEALSVFLSRDVDAVVFFLGSTGQDPFLNDTSYGDYVASLLTGPLPEISNRVDLVDGVVLQLAERATLKAELERLRGERRGMQ